MFRVYFRDKVRDFAFDDIEDIYEYLYYDCCFLHEEAAAATGWCELADFDDIYETDDVRIECLE